MPRFPWRAIAPVVAAVLAPLAPAVGALTDIAAATPVAGSSTVSAAAAPAGARTWGDPYWPGNDWVRGVTMRADGTGGYVLDGYGGIHPFAVGGNQLPPAATNWPARPWGNWDMARGIALLPNGRGGYIVDGWGGVHAFGIGGYPAPAGPRTATPYWRNWDIARGIVINPAGTGGYVLNGWGAMFPFAIGNNAVPGPIAGGPYMPWNDIFQDAVLLPGGGALLIDRWGNTYDAATPGSGYPGRVAGTAAWGQWDIVRGITVAPNGATYVLDGWGALHAFPGPSGAATNYGFMATEPNGAAVRYNPCEFVRYVINPARMPSGGAQLVHEAVAEVSRLTGLYFTFLGYTDEPAVTNRATSQPLRYGLGAAPVLVAWTDPNVIVELAGSLAGLGGSAARTFPGGQRQFVTGVALLDGPQLATLPTGFGVGVTQGDLVLHELLHVVGLSHTSDPSEMMYPSATPWAAVAGKGDRAGAARLGMNLSCGIPTGQVSGASAASTDPTPDPVSLTDQWVYEQ